MKKELSKKDQKIKELMEKSLSSPQKTWLGRSRQIYRILPSDPRCTACYSPFAGLGGAFVKTFFNKRRSKMNPLICNQCEELAARTGAGVETTMSMLFADIRGSTPLAESMGAFKFKHLIEQFYMQATRVLSHSMALIDKLAGDQVSGFYLPGYLGKDYASTAVTAAQNLLRVTGHTNPEGPWAPVGVGINTGIAYFGVVGNEDELVEITALGDEVNVAARLASQADTGEIILSESTVKEAGLDTSSLKKRTLELKGKSKPVDAWVMHVSPI